MVLLSLQINKINQKIRIDKAVYELNIIKQKVVFLFMRRMGKVLFSESKVSVPGMNVGLWKSFGILRMQSMEKCFILTIDNNRGKEEQFRIIYDMFGMCLCLHN